MIVAYIDTPGN